LFRDSLCVEDWGQWLSLEGSVEKQLNSRSLHYATPDFLLRLVALANFMRLSILKAAHVDPGYCRVAGNSGTLRSG
jgi:hypothetical protein